MAYKILELDGEVRLRNGKEVLGSAAPDEVISKRILDPEKRIVEAVSSSDRQDRDGDRINQQGIKHVGRVVCYAHDYGQKFLPIGKILSTRVEKTKAADGTTYHRTIEKHQFNPKGSYELSDSAYKLIEFGSLTGLSISFIPTKIIRPGSDQERQEMNLGQFGVFFERSEKLETSWCPVQSNRDAIREAFGKGIITRTDTKVLFPDNWHEVNKPKHWVVGTDFLKDPQLSIDDLQTEITKLKTDLDERNGRLLQALTNLKTILDESQAAREIEAAKKFYE